MIGQQDITGPDIRAAFDLLTHRLAHGPEMHRYVGGIGHQVACRIKQGAGKIEPLLDIGGDGRFLQHAAHLFGNGHEQVGKNRKLHGIDRPINLSALVAANGNLHIAELGDLCPAIRLHHNGCRLLNNDGRPAHPMTCCQFFHQIKIGLLPTRAEVTGNHAFFFRFTNGNGNSVPDKTSPPADGTNPVIINEYLPLLKDKAKLPPITSNKGLTKTALFRLFDHQGGIRSPVTQVEIPTAEYLFPFHALGGQFRFGLLLQLVKPPLNRCHCLGRENQGRWLLFFHHRVGKTDTAGRQDTGKAVNKNGGNSQDTGNGTGMLGTGPAECGQHMFLDIKAAHHRHLADGPHHNLVGHLQKPKGGFLNGQRRPIIGRIETINARG